MVSVFISKDACICSMQLCDLVDFSLVPPATCKTSIPLLPLTHIPIATVQAPQLFAASSRHQRAFSACNGHAMLLREVKN
jgi:hypothetical protein